MDLWQACLLSALVTIATLWLRLALDEPLGGRPTLVMFTIPIMLSAYVGGLWPGLLSTALVYLLTSYYLLAPIHSLDVASFVDRWQQFFVVLAGVLISGLNEALHRAKRQASIADEMQRQSRAALLEAGSLHGQRMGGIVESAMDAIISVDESQRIVLFNAAAERMFGHARAVIVGQALECLIPERFRAPHGARVVSFGRTGTTSRSMRSLGALMALRADGSEFPIEASISHIQVSGQKIYTVILRDISERMRAERTLRDSEDRLQAVTENLTEGLIVADMDGQILHWNRAGLQMHDFRDLREGLQTLPQFSEIFELRSIEGNHLIPVGQWPLARLLRGEPVRDMQVRVLRIAGQWERVFNYSGAIVDYADDRRMAFLSITDFTDRERASSHLRAQLERLRLLDQITRAVGERQDLHGIYQVVLGTLEDQLPADFTCVFVNEEGSDILTAIETGPRAATALAPGFALSIRDNLPGGSLSNDLLYVPDASTTSRPLNQALETAGLHSFVMAPLQSESRTFGAMLVARRLSSGFDSGECEFIRQLSAHVALAAHQAQLYAHLQSAFDELRRTQQAVTQQERLRALGQMASGIAHDINNAISPAMLYAENLLEHEALGERARGYVQSIARAVDDVAATVARMREFYRAREPQLELLPLALDDLVRQVIELSRARWSDMPQQRGIVIEVATEFAEALPQVIGVESEIREALINLVFNAVDAMPEGGRMTVRTRLIEAEGVPGSRLPGPPYRVALEVSDTGVGMDEATKKRCLEPFYTTKGERGTGLGLAMVYGTVQRHGASVEIDSAPGCGTTIRMAFAVKPEVSVEPRQALQRVQQRLRLLLVDDDPTLLHALRNTLEGDGHVTHSAIGGQAGIDAFAAAAAAAQGYDVVITDLGMPYRDGRAVAAAVKRLSPATPVILLTGWGQRMADEGDTPAEVDLVLSKPPRLVELRSALAKCWRPGQS